jgi:predicted alpha/beta superfamily hydrolase
MQHRARGLLLVLVSCSSSSTLEPPEIGDASGSSAEAEASADAATNEDGAAMDADATVGSSITLRVHYPAGAHTLTVRGSVAPLDWNNGTPLSAAGNDTWTLSVAIREHLEWKPVLDDVTLSRGPNYQASPGDTVDVYPHFTTIKGSWTLAYDAFSSTVLGNTRGIWIYKPPSYDENTAAHFPVVYMQDGQSLFDPTTAPFGQTWLAADTMDAAAESGAITEAIIVGVGNTAARIDEYTPTADMTFGGGKADLYLRMLVEELKPAIDATYRTMPDAAHTAIAGSSLGGLLAAYGGVMRADVFGRVGALSPSSWWDNSALLGIVATIPGKAQRAGKVYVDSGDVNDSAADVANLAKAYRDVGYVDDVSLKYVLEAGGTHTEASWAKRLPGALAFLLGPRVP